MASAPAADQNRVSSRLPELRTRHSRNLNFPLFGPVCFHVPPFHLPHLLLFQLPAPALVPPASSRAQSRPIQARSAFIWARADANYGVNRSISGEARGRRRVNRRDGLREAAGTKEEMRGGEEEGRGHLIEMEIEQAN